MRNFLNKFIIPLLIINSFFINFEKTITFATPSNEENLDFEESINDNDYYNPEILFEAQGVVLMDAETGQLLYSKNPHTKYEPASITKVMTAIIVLENTNLTDQVTVGENPPLVDGSAIGLETGEIYTVEELLIALILDSANDAAETLAEHIAGSNGAFGKLMTERAKELGALNTEFKNPSGLQEEGHLTTAYDMALIMRHASSFDDFVRISQIETYEYINHPFSNGDEKWAANGNRILFDWSIYHYEPVFTGKTGWTSDANHTYVSAAKKDDKTLIGTFINSLNRHTHFENVAQLYDWGFNNFTTSIIIEEGEVIGEYKIDDETTIPLIADRDISYAFAINDDSDFETNFEYPNKDLSKTTINEGDSLFTATLSVNGQPHATLDLLSGIDRVYEYIPPVISPSSKILTIIKNNFIFFALLLVILFLIIRRIHRAFYLKKLRKKIKNKYNIN